MHMPHKVMVLGIVGSPRKDGNSAYLLKHALGAAENYSPDEVEVEEYSLVGRRFAPCLACRKCVELKGECTQKDDFQELRDRWMGADAIIYSVPVYHMSIPGQLKCFIDRLGNSLYSYYGGVVPRQYKVIGAIAQGSHIFSGQEHTITDLINHALIMGCIPVTGDAWQSYIGTAGWTKKSADRGSMQRLYEQSDFDAVAAVDSAKSLGKRVAEVALMIKAGAKLRKEIIMKDLLCRPFIERVLSR